MVESCCSKVGKFFQSIVTDLQTFNWKEWLFMFLFGSLMVVFSVIDFNYLLKIDNTPYLLAWDNSEVQGYEYWQRVIMTLSGVASFTGAMCVFLVAKGKLSSYFWGIINTIVYGIFAWVYGYAGDAQFNIFYFLPIQFVGIYTWFDNRDRNDTAYSRSLNWWQWVLVVLGVVGLGVGFFYEIPAFSKWLVGYYIFEGNLAPHILDATSNALSIVAQILLTTRNWEQWILWILVDIVQITMYAGVAGFGVSFNILCMWTMFFFNAIFGLYQWYIRTHTQTGTGISTRASHSRSGLVTAQGVRMASHPSSSTGSGVQLV